VVFPLSSTFFFNFNKNKNKTGLFLIMSLCNSAVSIGSIHWVSGLYDGIILKRIAVPALFLSLSHSKTIKQLL